MLKYQEILEVKENIFVVYRGFSTVSTQHIHCGLTPLPFGTLLTSVATSYMLETIGKMSLRSILPIGSAGIVWASFGEPR